LRDDPDWRDRQFMEPGTIPADWRHRRVAVRVTLERPYAFVDVEAPETHVALGAALAPELAALDIDHLDVGLVRGRDRRVTRLLARWAATPDPSSGARYAGIRYVSRLGDWECWAVFEDVGLVERERRPIARDLPELQHIADLFGLRLH